MFMLEFNDVSLKTNKKDKRETMEKRGKNRRIKAVITCSFISYTKIWQTYVDIVVFQTLIFNLFFGNRLTVVQEKKKKKSWLAKSDCLKLKQKAGKRDRNRTVRRTGWITTARERSFRNCNSSHNVQDNIEGLSRKVERPECLFPFVSRYEGVGCTW